MKILDIMISRSTYKDPAAPLIQVIAFNRKVVDISFKALRLGFVWRRYKEAPSRFTWYKTVWNKEHNCWSWKICSFREAFKPWNPNE